MTFVPWLPILAVGLFLFSCSVFWAMSEFSASRTHKRRMELLGRGIRPEDIDRHLSAKESK